MSTTAFTFDQYCDDLGPAKVVHVYDPCCGLRGIVVIDNVACGPSIGGVRMAIDVSTRRSLSISSRHDDEERGGWLGPRRRQGRNPGRSENLRQATFDSSLRESHW